MTGQSELQFGRRTAAARHDRRPAVRRADDLPAAFAPAACMAAPAVGLDGRARSRRSSTRCARLRGARDRAADPFRALRMVAPERSGGRVRPGPYPRPGHADGLAFSAGHGRPVSLRRIFEILKADRPGWQPPERWVARRTGRARAC
jgi:uracil-DNA glycosylase